MVAANQQYGRNCFLPLTAGLMWGYARKFPEIADDYQLAGILYLKEPIRDAIGQMEKPDVVAFSHYIWNAEWNRALARAIKARWPRCATIVGGVQVASGSSKTLATEVSFDFAISGEGEKPFADFLRTHGSGEPDYERCSSLIWRSSDGIRVNARGADLSVDEIPSPYLDGLFDQFVRDPRFTWNALAESNRGCPYACTFCAWGAASLSKLRQFSMDRIVEEFDWMGRTGCEVFYSCDANVGILKRDVEMIDALVRVKERYGYPKKMRAAFAKNSNDVVFAISKRLNDAGMLKATTLALQSMNDDTLTLIRRKNIKYDRLAELSDRYEAAGIATYTEIIVGLPGETLETYVAGLDQLLDSGQHDGISIYLCVLLESTTMAEGTYRQEHGIESVEMKAMLYHGTPDEDVVEEVQETVVGTKSMPRAELRRAVLYGWLVQAFHSLGLTQRIARQLRAGGAPYSRFYIALLDWSLSNTSTIVGREVARVAALWDGAVAGGSWTAVDRRFGSVSWPPEELLFLNVACESKRFYAELSGFLDQPELIDEQSAAFIPPVPGDEELYAREAVWYGRKGQGRRLRLKA
jgi:putative methyltransferase